MFSYAGRAQPLFFWGHRGAPTLAVENTVTSFQRAFANDLHGVEFDVQFSRDGIPFIFHDDDLERLAHMPIAPSSLSWDELNRITIQDPIRPELGDGKIPRLAEVLAVIPECRFVNLELKQPGALTDENLRHALRLLDEYAVRQRTLISSFQPQHLYQVKNVDPSMSLAVLWEGKPVAETIRHVCQDLSPVMHVPLRWIEQFEMTGWRPRTSAVAVWGLKNVEDVDRCLRAGVDAVFIDGPEWKNHVRSS